MKEEKSAMGPLTGADEKRMHLLEARKQQLLQRKDVVKDSFVSKHIDVLLLEVEDLITKYDQSSPLHDRPKRDS